MSLNLKYYIIILICLLIVIISLVGINYQNSSNKYDYLNIETKLESDEETYKNNFVIKEDNKVNKSNVIINDIRRLIFPMLIVVSFFVGCYISAVVIDNSLNNFDKLIGVYFLLSISFILFIASLTVFKNIRIIDYIKGLKFSKLGVIIVIGIGSLVFGFIDNFAMKLGTDALDNTFLKGFLGPLSKDTRFEKYSDVMQENLQIINNWTQNDWIKVMNQVLRFRDDIDKNPKMKDLSKVLNDYKCQKLSIPNEILKDKEITNQFIDGLRNKFEVIDGSKAMLGNAFSNFCAALLASAIVGLFTFLTTYDSFNVGNKEKNNFSKFIGNIEPLLNAIFIVIGCLIPVFLVIAMKKSKYDNNSSICWIIIFGIIIIVCILMFLSYKNISKITLEEKKNALKYNLDNIKKRLNISTNSFLGKKINNFIKDI